MALPLSSYSDKPLKLRFVNQRYLHIYSPDGSIAAARFTTSDLTSCARGRHNMPMPPASWPLTFWLESGVRVPCDVGYLCANFSLPRPLCSRLRPDMCDRQTSDAHHRLMPPPYGAGHNNDKSPRIGVDPNFDRTVWPPWPLTCLDPKCYISYTRKGKISTKFENFHDLLW